MAAQESIRRAFIGSVARRLLMALSGKRAFGPLYKYRHHLLGVVRQAVASSAVVFVESRDDWAGRE